MNPGPKNFTSSLFRLFAQLLASCVHFRHFQRFFRSTKSFPESKADRKALEGGVPVTPFTNNLRKRTGKGKRKGCLRITRSG